MTRSVCILISMIAFLGTAAPALSADPPVVLQGPTVVGSIVDRSEYGTADLSAFAIADRVFQPYSSLATFNWSGGRYTTNDSPMFASVHLPSGARVDSIEMRACDESATGSVMMLFARCPKTTASCFATAALATGATQVPGCGIFSLPLPGEPVIDNDVNSYVLHVQNSTFDGSTRWSNFRVYYQRQVSPAPLTATFGDVPTGHALHQYVEALVSSGITAGCGGGNYCPNDTITRGQMAVFLAKALGLHWAP